MSPLRQLLGRIGLGFALIVIVSPAVLFFLWMLSLSVKFEVDNASYPPVFIPEHFNWGNYAAVIDSKRFSTYFTNSLIVTGAATAFALLVGVPAGVEEPHAAVRTASEVRQDPASASRPVIADALMDSPSSGKRRSL